MQFNSILLNFLGFQPYATPSRGLSYASDPSFKGTQAFAEGVTPEFFDHQQFGIAAQSTVVRLVAHQIRLDQSKKPKSFYEMQVFFQEKLEDKIDYRKKKSEDSEKDAGAKGQAPTVRSIKLEKVYGDFKRLHEHITDTFRNEISEYERFQSLIDGRNTEYVIAGDETQRLISMNFDTGGGTQKFREATDLTVGTQQSESNGIILDEGTIKEHERYGLMYFEEAKRILTHMPKFPAKHQEQQFGSAMYDATEATKVSPDQLMLNIQAYMNELLELSPLIPTLFYVRDFLTCDRSRAASGIEAPKGLVSFTSKHDANVNLGPKTDVAEQSRLKTQPNKPGDRR